MSYRLSRYIIPLSLIFVFIDNPKINLRGVNKVIYITLLTLIVLVTLMIPPHFSTNVNELLTSPQFFHIRLI